MKNLLLIAALVAGVTTNVPDLASVRAVAAESGYQTRPKAAGGLVSRDQRSNSDRKLSSGQTRGSKSEQRPNTQQLDAGQQASTPSQPIASPGEADAASTDDGSECRPGEATPIPGASDRVVASPEQRTEGEGERDELDIAADEHYPEAVDHDCPCGKDCKCPPFVCKNKDCDKNYVIMFTAKWCKPCRQMYPRIDKLRKDGYLVYVYDIDEYPALKEQFQITSVPVIAVIDKRKEVKRFVGFTDPAEITKFVVKEADQKPDPTPNPTPNPTPKPDKYNFLPQASARPKRVNYFVPRIGPEVYVPHFTPKQP